MDKATEDALHAAIVRFEPYSYDLQGNGVRSEGNVALCDDIRAPVGPVPNAITDHVEACPFYPVIAMFIVLAMLAVHLNGLEIVLVLAVVSAIMSAIAICFAFRRGKHLSSERLGSVPVVSYTGQRAIEFRHARYQLAAQIVLPMTPMQRRDRR